MHPKVSVAIAAYNAAPYIAQAIESVLAQNYPSLEIVILNDGSTDRTGQILNAYRAHPLIRIISERHRGQGWAKNRLIKVSRGKYIALFDADDVMLPGRIEKQANVLDKHPSFGACYGNAKIVNTRLRPKKDKRFEAEFGISLEKSWDIIKIPVLPATLMFRKSIAEKISGFNRKFNYSADMDFMLRLAENARFFFLNEFLILYRRRKGTASHNKKMHEEEFIARKMAIRRRYGITPHFSL